MAHGLRRADRLAEVIAIHLLVVVQQAGAVDTHAVLDEHQIHGHRRFKIIEVGYVFVFGKGFAIGVGGQKGAQPVPFVFVERQQHAISSFGGINERIDSRI